jgi:hypothetical protein
MAATTATKTTTTEISIFGRILNDPKNKMSPDLARYVLRLGFNKGDQARMQELATKNQEGRIPPEEREELMNYVHAGHLLALLHSQARKSLKSKKAS